MTEINPKITVYIPSHNYGSYIEKSIDSVLKQTYKNWELILINDGSSDNTQEIINLYQGHEKIKCFKTNGIGLPAVCNLALKKSTGSLIIRLDGDDYFDENILLVLEKNLAENNSAAIAFADYYLINELGQIISHEKREKFNEKNNMLDIPPHGACTLIKKSVLKEVGGYREDLGAQDGLDLWTKIRDKYDAVNINLPLFFYRRHFKNLTNNNIKILTARRTINKDIVKQKIPNYSPIIAVIPCRKHFDFINNLWNEKLLNKTLLERDIETCLKSELVDKVVVTCDSDVVIKTLNKFNSKKLIFHLRDEKSTIRSISILPTLKKIVGKK